MRRGIALWWKTGLDVTPLPDNCFSFLYGFKIRGQGKGNDLVGAVVYLSFRGDEKETVPLLHAPCRELLLSGSPTNLAFSLLAAE